MRSTFRFKPSAVVMNVVVPDVESDANVEPAARVPVMKTRNGADRPLSRMPEESAMKETISSV
jgi:hypothetical protein